MKDVEKKGVSLLMSKIVGSDAAKRKMPEKLRLPLAIMRRDEVSCTNKIASVGFTDRV